ncbi:hypothetical protein [Bradyrhizobium sp. ORS 111]|uniref:hypothetical protein n=1 Tax=Bradyrhizobium sp. ORS 111 TaxID=1685958 RepID=UPI00388E6BEB
MKLRSFRTIVLLGGVLLFGVECVAQERLGQSPPARQILPRPEFGLPDSSMPVPGSQMPGADPFQLLENSEEVQADLGLTRDQIARLNRASRNFRTTLQELSVAKPGVSPEAQRAAVERHVRDTRGMIARELTPAQLGRLQQIMLQLEGPCLAVIDQAVAEQLKLNRFQQEAIGRACETRSAQMKRAFVAAPPGASYCTTMVDNRRRVEAIRVQADQQILALLESTQKDMFTRLIGKKLKLTAPMPPECN